MSTTPATISVSPLIWVVGDNPQNGVNQGNVLSLKNKGTAADATATAANSLNDNDLSLVLRKVLSTGASNKGDYVFTGTENASNANSGWTFAAVLRRKTANDNPDFSTILRVERSGPISGAQLEVAMCADGVANSLRIGGRRLSSDSFESVSSGVDHGSNWVRFIGRVDYTNAHISVLEDSEIVADKLAFQTAGLASAADAAQPIQLGHAIQSTNDNENYAVAELVLWNNALSDSDYLAIDRYLAREWTPPEIPQTDEEIWSANFADAQGAPPQTTALLRESDAQKLADHNVGLFLNGPQWYRFDVEVPIGEFDQFKPLTVRTFRANLPGLTNGKKLLIMSREGRTGSTRITLTCWG